MDIFGKRMWASCYRELQACSRCGGVSSGMRSIVKEGKPAKGQGFADLYISFSSLG